LFIAQVPLLLCTHDVRGGRSEKRRYRIYEE
jgi:hypothetical protein